MESFGSGDRSLDSAGSENSDRDWRKRHGISKASSQESIFSEEVELFCLIKKNFEKTNNEIKYNKNNNNKNEKKVKCCMFKVL